MTCNLCDLAEKKDLIVYQDEFVVATVAPEPVAEGHLWVFPRKHIPVMEAIPDAVFDRMFLVANGLSVAVFEAFGAGGTNILIKNGLPSGQLYPHTVLHVIPRKEGDGINMQWSPRPMDEEEMSTVELKLKEELALGQSPEQQKLAGATGTTSATPEANKTSQIAQIESKQGEENYLVKNVRRIP